MDADETHTIRGEGYVMDVVTRRMLMDMEAALERSTRWLPPDLNVHEVRAYIGQCILHSVQEGECTEDAMARAGIAAAHRVARGKANLEQRPPN